MAKVNEQIKERIKTLSRSDLEKLLLKAASKDKSFHDYLLINYADKDFGEKDIFEKAKCDINELYFKSYRGFAPQLRRTNMLSACIKRINEFSKICKNKNLEADLLMFVLTEAFAHEPKFFGTCFTAFDYKVGLLLKRLITLVTKKLHPDYLANYKGKINVYLTQLRSTSSHINFIYELPEKIE